MKTAFRLVTILAMCFCCVACQTTPKGKALTEMTDEEKRAVYLNGPIQAPQKEHHGSKTALAVVGAILLAMPIMVMAGLAGSGAQIHTGK